MLKVNNIHYSVGQKRILQGITTAFQPGLLHVIVGPNGSGKSTFLKIFSGELNKYAGTVLYDDDEITKLKKEDLARRRSVMSQQPELGFPLTVEEVVMMGRYPHFHFNPNKKDETICDEVMQRLKLSSFSERNYLTLSGGEKQRVQFARVLAQIWENPSQGYRYLFLDEPLNNLDINYQQEFLKLSNDFAKTNTVLIAILHDLNLALAYANRIFFMKAGKIAYETEPSEVTAGMIGEVFDVNATIIHPTGVSRPVVIYQ